MTKEEIQDFIESRSALSVSAFCREAGITKRYLDYILQGERPLTPETAEKLLPVMERYGWSKNK